MPVVTCDKKVGYTESLENYEVKPAIKLTVESL